MYQVLKFGLRARDIPVHFYKPISQATSSLPYEQHHQSQIILEVLQELELVWVLGNSDPNLETSTSFGVDNDNSGEDLVHFT